MKALSLTEPWASLVVTGEKQFETRSWKTSTRGLIAIQASKGFPAPAREKFLSEKVFRKALTIHGFDKLEDLTFGAIIGVAEIVEMIRTEDMKFSSNINEKMFGDYSPGRWAWRLENAQRLDVPVYCKGALSLWEVPKDVERKILKQL